MTKRIFHDIEQDDEWLKLRAGFITSSNFAAIQANPGKVFGDPAIQYAMKVAIESKTKRQITTFKNDWMIQGNEREADARLLYSNLNFVEVDLGGFMEYGRFGSSSDGLVETDGMVEIKCVKFNTHFKRLLKGGYDTAYRRQIAGQLWIYDREYCDFVSYCPDFPTDKQLYTFRVERDRDQESVMIERLNEFVTVVDSYIKHL